MSSISSAAALIAALRISRSGDRLESGAVDLNRPPGRTALEAYSRDGLAVPSAARYAAARRSASSSKNVPRQRDRRCAKGES